jgi:glycosyltransferase involved in cell wall biosynthesis
MKISIITATYNSAATVRDTIESVLRQTYKDVEYIVKDGGSIDDTLSICQEYETQFKGRMRIISCPDKGLYDAMNVGIEAATGDVIGLLNSDDFYTSDDVLQTVATAFVENSKLDAVYGDIHYVRSSDLNKCVRYYSSKHFRKERMLKGWMPAHPSFYCRREVYQKNGLYDTSFKVAADFEQLLRLIYIHNIEVKYIEKDFVTMRLGGASTSGWLSHVNIMNDHLRAFRQNGIRNNVFRLAMRYIEKLREYK